MNSLNAKWRTDLVVGNQQRLSTEFYRPVDYSDRLFVSAGLLATHIYSSRPSLGALDRYDSHGMNGVFAGSRGRQRWYLSLRSSFGGSGPGS